MAETDPMMQAEFQSRVSFASENGSLRSRVAELEGELSATRDGCESRLDYLRQELRSVNEETTTLRKIIFKLEHENAGLRAEKSEFMKIVKERDDLIDFRQTLRWQLKTVSDENAGLRAENERLLAACDGYKHDVIYARAELGKIAHTNASLRAILESFMKGLIDPGPDRWFYKILIHRCDIEKARAALGNPSETPISSGKR